MACSINHPFLYDPCGYAPAPVGSNGNPFTFKYNLGQKLFFRGEDAPQKGFHPGTIYEGEVIRRNLEQGREESNERYTLAAGKHHCIASVPVLKLGRSVQEVREMDVERLGEKKTS